jgi:hypothetical protein
MLDVDILDDEEQARTTGLQVHADDFQAHVTDFREEHKERHDQG